MSNVIKYSMSEGGKRINGKSVNLWRTEGGESRKIARFLSDETAELFAKEFNFPLSERLKKRFEKIKEKK